MIINFVFRLNPNYSREKHSIFECGFDPNSFSRLPFSMHFFLIALIFLIFDVEISLLVPIPLLWKGFKTNRLIWLFIRVLIILLLGALIEWKEKSLDWQS